MRTKYLGLIVVLSLLTTRASTSTQASGSAQSLTGEITDTLCAHYKGHQYMMKQMKTMGIDKKTCIQKCMQQLGAKVVLYSAGDGKVYVITNPERAEPFGGHMVQVSGTVKKDKVTILEIKAIE